MQRAHASALLPRFVIDYRHPHRRSVPTPPTHRTPSTTGQTDGVWFVVMPRDYYPLIARAVAGLEDNTRDARDALYRRARAAQRVHFGSVADPAEVRGEHHALEDAIRTVESEFTPLSPSIDPARSRVQDDADQPSRLLGLPPVDAYRRAQRQRRRRLRLKLAIGVVVALLVIVTAGLYWRSRQQGQPLAELTALAEKYTLAAPPEAMAPGT